MELAKAGDIQAAVLLHPSFTTVDDIKGTNDLNLLIIKITKQRKSQQRLSLRDIPRKKVFNALHVELFLSL